MFQVVEQDVLGQLAQRKDFKLIVAVTIAAMLAGCAPPGHRGLGASWEPVVDVRPHQQAQYAQDLGECQAHATKVMDAAQGAVAGAVAGALLGALLGAAAGGGSRFNTRMAGVGAISGGVGAAACAEGGQRGIISRCLAAARIFGAELRLGGACSKLWTIFLALTADVVRRASDGAMAGCAPEVSWQRAGYSFGRLQSERISGSGAFRR